MKYSLAKIEIPKDWKIRRNIFYNIDPTDKINEEDKFDNIYCQEDLLWIQNDNFNIDLGWYGGENSSAAFCVILYRGENWNNCILLEKFRSRSKDTIVNRINFLLSTVSEGRLDSLDGYEINESNNYDISDFEYFSVI